MTKGRTRRISCLGRFSSRKGDRQCIFYNQKSTCSVCIEEYVLKTLIKISRFEDCDKTQMANIVNRQVLEKDS